MITENQFATILPYLKRSFLLWIFILSIVSSYAIAAPPVIILYPKIKAPYSVLFADLTLKIQHELPLQTKIYPLSDNADPKEIQQWIANQKSHIVLALGDKSIRIGKQFDPHFKILGITSSPTLKAEAENVLLFRYNSDPKQVLHLLVKLLPKTRSVHVVYDPEHNYMLIQRAEAISKILKLEFYSYPAATIREGAIMYSNILKKITPMKDAVWILGDASLDESVILPLLIESAWNRRVIVISNQVNHVKKGALFAVLSDNLVLSSEIARTIKLLADVNNSEPINRKLGHIVVAVNARMSENLGHQLSCLDLRDYDLVFQGHCRGK